MPVLSHLCRQAGFQHYFLRPHPAMTHRLHLQETPITTLPSEASPDPETPERVSITNAQVNLKKRKLDQYANDGIVVQSGRVPVSFSTMKANHIGPTRSITALFEHFRALRSYTSITYAVWSAATASKRRLIESTDDEQVEILLSDDEQDEPETCIVDDESVELQSSEDEQDEPEIHIVDQTAEMLSSDDEQDELLSSDDEQDEPEIRIVEQTAEMLLSDDEQDESEICIADQTVETLLSDNEQDNQRYFRVARAPDLEDIIEDEELRFEPSDGRTSVRFQLEEDKLDEDWANMQLDEEDEEEELRRMQEYAEKQRRMFRVAPRLPPLPAITQDMEDYLEKIMAFPLDTGMKRLSNGVTITRRDLGTILPQENAGDRANGWLNDEIVNGALHLVVSYALEQTGHQKGQVPKFHAFMSMFMNNLKEKGPQAVERWSKRAGIGGIALWQVRTLFIPICSGSHWTLLVVSPGYKVVEYFDSMQGAGTEYYKLISRWLQHELDDEFKPHQWSFRTGYGPTQSNAKDCGVFVATTAKMVMLGLDPELSYVQEDLEMQRKRIVGEIISGGFIGDFEPAESWVLQG